MRLPKRLIAVVLFLFLLFAIFELTGFRAHFNLGFLQNTIRDHQASGLLIFVLIFALGNLVQIPGWVFLAAAVLALVSFGAGLSPISPLASRASSPSSPSVLWAETH
jgi:hypothetical protein